MLLERRPSAKIPNNVRDGHLLSFVNHILRRCPEIRPDTGQRSAFSFDSPLLTAVAQITGSPT